MARRVKPNGDEELLRPQDDPDGDADPDDDDDDDDDDSYDDDRDNTGGQDANDPRGGDAPQDGDGDGKVDADGDGEDDDPDPSPAPDDDQNDDPDAQDIPNDRDNTPRRRGKPFGKAVEVEDDATQIDASYLQDLIAEAVAPIQAICSRLTKAIESLERADHENTERIEKSIAYSSSKQEQIMKSFVADYDDSERSVAAPSGTPTASPRGRVINKAIETATFAEDGSLTSDTSGANGVVREQKILVKKGIELMQSGHAIPLTPEDVSRVDLGRPMDQDKYDALRDAVNAVNAA